MHLHHGSFVLGIASTALAGVVLLSNSFVSSTTAQPMSPDQHLAMLLEEHHAVKQAAQRAQMMAVAYQLDSAGFHDLDESLAAGRMVSGALGTARKARIAVQATMWPHELSDNAARLVTQFQRLEDALRDEDVARAAPAAKEVHDLYHSLSDNTYTILSGAVPSEHSH